MFGIPFVWCVVALIAVAIIFLGVDLRQPPSCRHRWREYSFIAVCGLLAALFGLAVDSVTSRLSPEYFVLGKGIAPGPTFNAEVLELGAKAGLSAGVVASAILVFFNPRPALAFTLVRLVWMPFALAVLVGFSPALRWFSRLQNWIPILRSGLP